MKSKHNRTLAATVLLAPALAFATALPTAPAQAGEVGVTMPETPAGAIGAELIARINKGDAPGIRKWAGSILSPAMDQAMGDLFVKQLGLAARDSGGVDFVDVRVQGPPGMLVVTLKGRRSGRLAALVLIPDPDAPGKLAMADLVPIDDPTLFDAWPDAGASNKDIARLTGIALDTLVRTNDFSGCVTITDGSRTIFDQCHGLAERRFGIAIDQSTRFHIGSMNKMFTAVAIAQLVEAGKLSWDDTVAMHIPEYPDRQAASGITVWQMLHHTSGLGDYMVPEFFQRREDFIHPADYLGLIAGQPKVGEPGGDWSYSNSGFMLLGRIIEAVSGETYPDYVERHIFVPAGMTASGYDVVDEVVPNLAVGYFREGVFSTEWKADWYKTPYAAGPAGGGYSNNADLVRFATALRAGKLVKSPVLAQMFENAVPAGPGTYAAGFGQRMKHGRHIRGHAGGIEGTDANIAIVWETGATVVVTSNQGPGQSWYFAERIADLLAAQSAQ